MTLRPSVCLLNKRNESLLRRSLSSVPLPTHFTNYVGVCVYVCVCVCMCACPCSLDPVVTYHRTMNTLLDGDSVFLHVQVGRAGGGDLTGLGRGGGKMKHGAGDVGREISGGHEAQWGWKSCTRVGQPHCCGSGA